MSIASIFVYADAPDLQAQAQTLAAALDLPVSLDRNVAAGTLLLLLTPGYLSLCDPHSRSVFYLDFLSATMRYRQRHSSPRKEKLAQALGLKKYKPNYIIDATAGLGRDSFIIAGLGVTVTLIERSAIIHALLAEALARASVDPALAPSIARMRLVAGDAHTLIPQLPRADVIYLDPMFPTRRKSASVKKEMQLFHRVIGADNDADNLLKLALTCAAKRVVVKRPKLAGPLADLTPTYSVKGNSSRFDVYINQD